MAPAGVEISRKGMIISTLSFGVYHSSVLLCFICVEKFIFKSKNLQKLVQIFGKLYKQFSDFYDFNFYESKISNIKVYNNLQEIFGNENDMFTNTFNNLLTKLHNEYDDITN